MHWLSARLETLSTSWERYQHQPSLALREAFLSEVEDLITALGERTEVITAFAAHDGLLVAVGGESEAVEALAAMAQACTGPSLEASRVLGLGPLRQQVLVGAHRKLALLHLPTITIGILSAQGADLALALQPPPDHDD